MEIETYLYPYSANEARKRGELALWRASHQANISCKRAIEESIRQNFDGMRLNNGCVDEVWIQKDRVGTVKHDPAKGSGWPLQPSE